MDKLNYIWQYYQAIMSGKVNAGEWVRRIYKLIIDGLQEKRFYFDQKKATDAVEWIETHCYHTEGPLAPGPVTLELWERALVSAIFGIVDDKGRLQHREVFLVVGRKNGKTKLCACIAAYVWRLAGGYGSRVFCVAPKLEQASLVYDDVWQMTLLDPEYQALKEAYSERDVHNKKTADDSDLPRHRVGDLSVPAINATVKKVAYNVKTSDGLSPSLAILDEVAAWEGDKGLKQFEVMRSGMGAKEGLLIAASTAGYVNDGIYDELMKRATRYLLGDSKEKKLLPVIYMIDDVEKWDDINELQKSMPNLGVSVSVDYMLEEIAVAEGSLSKKSEFLTKYCNIKQSSSMALLPAQEIEAITGDPVDLSKWSGYYAVGGVDLSQTTDLTCGLIIVEDGGRLNVHAHFWLPAARIQEASLRDGVPYEAYIKRGFLSPSGENYIDYRDVYTWFTDLVEKYKIYPLKIGYDRYSATYLVQDLAGYGYHMDDVYQGDNLWGCIQEVTGAVKDKRLYIGDNDLLKIHLLNSAVKMSTERGRGRLVKISPTAHIDGMAALLCAMAVKQKYAAEIGEQLKNERQ